MKTPFDDLLNNVSMFNRNIEQEVIQATVGKKADRKRIVDLNIHDQQYERGEFATGQPLPAYAKATVDYWKPSKGQRADHTTLRDSQEFHASFDITLYCLRTILF